MNAPVTTVAKKEKTIFDIISQPNVKAQMALALPKHMSADRLARIAMTEMRKNPKLAQCDVASMIGALMQCAQLGLEPGGALGHAYLIPFNNKKKNITEVQFIVGYRGMIDLARRSGQIVSLTAHCVHQHDKFSYQLGLHEDLTHVPSDGERGDVTHVYAVARLQGGGVQFIVMSRLDVEKVRSQSKAAGDGPWVTHWEEMAKKTCIRNLFKYLPVSIELATAVSLDERASADISQDNASILTGEFSTVDDDAAKLPDCTEESFNGQKEEWKAVVVSGKKSANDLIKTIETRELLSDDQKIEIASWSIKGE